MTIQPRPPRPGCCTRRWQSISYSPSLRDPRDRSRRRCPPLVSSLGEVRRRPATQAAMRVSGHRNGAPARPLRRGQRRSAGRSISRPFAGHPPSSRPARDGERISPPRENAEIASRSAARPRPKINHSHSMVPGGFEVTS
ncbi:hypothetical protein A33M_3283 [Rhodovulum sp. PH10]|nr:hypothetical protein A33M_3283 [Rhodovulum sp. PH10]